MQAATREESQHAPRNSNRDLTSLRQQEWSRRALSQLKRNHNLPIETQEKPQDSPLNVRRGPFPEQCLQRNPTLPLETLKGTGHTLCNSGRSPRYLSPLERNTMFHDNSRRAPLSPFSSRDGRFPCFIGKRIPTFLSQVKRRPVLL